MGPCPAARSRSLALLAGALALQLGCGGAPPTPPDGAPGAGVPAAVALASHSAPPLIFVGLDGADWRQLDTAIAAGHMPELARLVQEGHGGVLLSQDPPLSPLVWTTMMTGTSPLEHGILDFTRFNPASGAKEPITSDERRVPAIWNLSTIAGRRLAVLGMWATWPAEPIDGLLVSDRLFSFQHRQAEPPPAVVFPAERAAWARAALASVVREVDAAALARYLPWLAPADYQSLAEATDPYAAPVSALRRILVETRVYHRLALDALAELRPDLAILYIQGTDAIGHVFAPYAPPRLPAVPPADFERYRGVAPLYFAEIDRQLGDYRRLAQAVGARLVLASDHGFLWGEGRPSELPSLAAATAGKWHRDEGIYLLWGPGIAAAPGHPGRGGVAQVCATLLCLAGLPAATGIARPPLPGTPAAAACAAAAAVDYRPFWRRDAPTVAAPAPAAQEELAKLRALGYLGGAEPSQAPAAARGSTRTPASYNNEGLIREQQGDRQGAAAAFARALAIDPTLASANWNLSDLLFAEGRDLERADDLLVRALAADLPGGVGQVVSRAMEHHRAGRGERSLALLTAALAVRPDDPQLHLFHGRYAVEAGDCAGALTDFQAAARRLPEDPAVWSASGLARLCLGDPAGGARDLRRSLTLDPDQPRVREFLAGLAGNQG